MWTRNDTVVTTTSMTTVSVSMYSDHGTLSLPTVSQFATGTTKPCGSEPKPTEKNAIHDRKHEIPSRPVVICSAVRGSMVRRKAPAMRKPTSGRKTMRSYIMVSALQRIDVFDRDGAAVAVIGDQDGKADRRLRRSDG